MGRPPSHAQIVHRPELAHLMTGAIEIAQACNADAVALAEIHLAARAAAMPYLFRAFSDDETRTWFRTAIGEAWWLARGEARPVGYKLIEGENLHHLYVLPGWQRRGIGVALLGKAKPLSPKRLRVSTFRRKRRRAGFP